MSQRAILSFLERIGDPHDAVLQCLCVSLGKVARLSRIGTLTVGTCIYRVSDP